MTNMIEKMQVNMPRWLFHIDIFNESIIEEYILDIKLTNEPFVGHNNRKQNMNSSSIDNRTKSVSVV